MPNHRPGGLAVLGLRRRQVIVYDASGDMDKRYGQPAAWQINQMYVDEMSHFLDCMVSGHVPVNPLSRGIAALEIATIAKAYTSKTCH